MEEPVVTGWDAALDVTRCQGRLVLEIPPGAERGFAGERHLRADIGYTAQAAADGNGFVYRLTGGDPIVSKLVAFNMTSGAYQPPPAIDETQVAAADTAAADEAAASAPAPGAAPSAGMPNQRQAEKRRRT
ncbi:hypothetical protein [Sphingomonas sp.]|uniref:hypothetical protein n=1 Tax=Sphingomonas sp. TaxID=28214 RepID=UPI003B000970